MSRFKLDGNQIKALAIATGLALIVGVIFLRHYLILIAVAAIVAYIFNPIYKRLLDRSSKPGKAANYTLLISLLSLVIPITLVLIVLVFQLNHVVDVVKDSGADLNLSDLSQKFIDHFNNLMHTLGISYQLSETQVAQALSNSIQTIGQNLLQGLTSSINGVIGFITIAIIYMYVFLSILKNQNKIMDTFHKLNPLGPEISQLYSDRIGAMTKAMVKGQFVIAFLQGTVDTLLLWLGGIHTGLVFFEVILVALSIVPLGGGILVLPIGVVMMLSGNIVGGLIVILGHLLIVTNIDNILRPRLVPDRARLDPALTMLAVFAGLGIFGFIGIVLGPVLMIVLVTTVQVYLEVFKGDPLVESHTKRTNLMDTLKTKLHLDDDDEDEA